MAASLSHSDEAHDLRIVLAAGGVSAIVLAVVVLLSAQTGVLDIPARPTLFLAALTAGVALLGWAALQLDVGVRRIAWTTLTVYVLIATASTLLPSALPLTSPPASRSDIFRTTAPPSPGASASRPRESRQMSCRAARGRSECYPGNGNRG